MGVEGQKKRNILLHLAAEGVVPVLGGCAGAMAGGSPEAGLAGVAVGRAVEKAVNLFGKGIVGRWEGWMAERPPAEAAAAVSELVALTPAEVREEAHAILLELAPEADPKDLAVAVEYLSALPRAVDRALVPDPAGGRTVPPTLSLADPRQLLQLLPEDVPPYPTGADLPGTPYRLVELVGTGGFGAVYRAFSPTLQHLPLAVKFCLDRTLLPALNQERSNLERLMRAGGPGAAHVVRLYGYDLDHPTPFLVYEYVAGGDLTAHLAARRAALGRPPGPDEVLGWVIQIADGLAFAHRAGLVHRDLKPANVLADGGAPKLADFGLGGVAVRRAVQRSRIGASTMEYLSLAEQASLFRGAGTPLYMSPEQRRGADPDPRHDLYALGVMWFQLLVGDVSRELPPGWAKELRVRYGVPADHIELIERCVGWYDDRPKDAGELLPLLREAAGWGGPGVLRDPTAFALVRDDLAAAVAPPSATSALTPEQVAADPARKAELVARLRGLEKQRRWTRTVVAGTWVGLAAVWLLGVQLAVRGTYYELRRAGMDPPWYVVSAAAAGLAVALASWWGAAAVRRGQTRRWEEAAGRFAYDYPRLVRAWGGRPALDDPGAVAQALAELAPPAASAPPTATSTLSPEQITSDPTRKAVLIARLRDQADLLYSTDNLVAFCWLGQIVLSLAVGGGVGGLVGYLFDSMRFNDWVYTTSGVAAGAVAAALTWVAVTPVRRSLHRKRDDETARLAADYRRLVELWGGERALLSQETVETLLKTYDPEYAGWRRTIRRWFGG